MAVLRVLSSQFHAISSVEGFVRGLSPQLSLFVHYFSGQQFSSIYVYSIGTQPLFPVRRAHRQPQSWPFDGYRSPYFVWHMYSQYLRHSVGFLVSAPVGMDPVSSASGTTYIQPPQLSESPAARRSKRISTLDSDVRATILVTTGGVASILYCIGPSTTSP